MIVLAALLLIAAVVCTVPIMASSSRVVHVTFTLGACLLGQAALMAVLAYVARLK